MKVVTVVGARPQFVKMSAVSPALQRAGLQEVVVHTGQHHDEELSARFFAELQLPVPAHALGVGSLPHGAQTGRMLEAIERVLLAEAPRVVLVYGETNSTLAGALAAAKLAVPVAHVEAGLRSFDMTMPEEVNRVVTDRLAALAFCPTPLAVDNLRREACTARVELVGDVMYDAALLAGGRARQESRVLAQLGVSDRGYVLATVHRAANTDLAARLRGIVQALVRLAQRWPVVLPLHPRTRARAAAAGLTDALSALHVIEPVGYLDMLRLQQAALVVCTDSGGVQKEAFFCRVPCVTLRETTEWMETVACGWNVLAGADPERIVGAVERLLAAPPPPAPSLHGDGRAAERIAASLRAFVAALPPRGATA